MKRVTLLALPLVTLALLAWPATSSAASKLANGLVKSVTGASLTITDNGKDMTFTVDAKTRAVGKGMSTKSAAKGGKSTIPDLFSAGDRVAVTYTEASGTMRASRIELVAKGATK